MARIRTIKPEFWTAEQVLDCSPLARLLFIGMWNFCDDGGNHPASLKTIKAEVFPGDDINSDDIRRLIDELLSNDLLAEYEAGGKTYWHVTGWHHQKIEKPSYKHPAYAPQCGDSWADREQNDDLFGDRSATDPGKVADDSPPEGKGREGKVKGEDKNKGGAAKFDPIAIDLHGCIRADMWADWIEYRRSRRLTTNEKTMQAQVRNLVSWHAKGHDPNRIIATSIASGWQGIFEPKPQAQPHGSRPASGRQAAIDSYAAQAAAARGENNHEQHSSNPEFVIDGQAERIA